MTFTSTRRVILTALAATPMLSKPLRAQAAFPDKPIRLIVPFAPGGNSDLTARACAPAMSAKLGQPVVVENRAGAGGSVAAQQVAPPSARWVYDPSWFEWAAHHQPHRAGQSWL